MKTIKTNIASSGISLYLKAILIGTIVAVLITALGMCMITWILLIAGILPKNIIVWIMIGLCSLSSLISGYISARITKNNGMLTGTISGVVIFLITMFSGFAATEDTVSYYTLIKFVAFILSGAIGGIKGVNIKEKIRIK